MLLSAVSSPKKEGQIPVLVPRKRSHRILAVFLLTLFLVVAGILLEGLLVKLPIISKCEDANERVGVIHVHTRASDGSGTVAEVMAAAEKANLSFIAITDHNVAMTESDLAEDPPDLPIISGVEVGTSCRTFPRAGHSPVLGSTENKR